MRFHRQHRQRGDKLWRLRVAKGLDWRIYQDSFVYWPEMIASMLSIQLGILSMSSCRVRSLGHLAIFCVSLSNNSRAAAISAAL